MIPKIIHHVWVGPNSIPTDELNYIQSWKVLHPDWKFFMWKNDNINQLNINQKCLDAIKNLDVLYACQADIIRYFAVNLLGGFYIDTDIECFKPIDDLLFDSLQFIGLRPHKGNWITNAFFGSNKNNPILINAIQKIVSTKHKTKNPYGPQYLTEQLVTFYTHKGEITDLQNSACRILNYDFWSTKSTDPYCRHYFRASWRKK